MSRALLLSAIGLVAGAAGGYYAAVVIAGHGALRAAGPALQQREPSASDAARRNAEGSSTMASTAQHRTKLAILEKAARIDDPDVLEAALLDAASMPKSYTSRVETEALLMRLGDLDPQRAAEASSAFDLSADLVAIAYRRWAESDLDAAVGALRAIPSPLKRRAAALALLDVTSFGPGIAQVAAGLEPGEAASFTIDALAKQTELDPRSALEFALALGLGSIVRDEAISSVARAMSRTDPRSGSELAALVSDPREAASFRGAMQSWWPYFDPASYLAYLETTDDLSGTTLAYAGPALEQATPEQLLALADRLPPATNGYELRFVMLALAEKNPAAALQRAEALPLGQTRTTILESVAHGYARHSPEAALGWADSIVAADPAQFRMLDTVLSSIAQDDPSFALNSILDRLSGEDPSTSRGALVNPLMRVIEATPAAEIALIMDRLAATGSRTANELATTVTAMRWASVDPERALIWMLAHLELFGDSHISGMATQLGGTERQLATATIDRLPAEHRDSWIIGVADGIAVSDGNEAADWIARFRGQPVHERALRRIVQTVARSEPEIARQIVVQHVSDAELRRQLEAQLDGAASRFGR